MTSTSTTYFQRDIPITEDQARELLATAGSEPGTPYLRVSLYYYRDSNPRGLKLSVSRVLKGDTFTQTLLMSKTNGLMHLKTVPRKNDKVGHAMAVLVERNLDEIKQIALASDTPDFRTLLVYLQGQMEPVAA